MLTALIHSSSLRELTEISSSFICKPLCMERGEGLKGGLQWRVQMVMIKYCVHVSTSCILMFTTKNHDNVNSLKVNNLIEYRYFYCNTCSSMIVFKEWEIFTASGVVQVLI